MRKLGTLVLMFAVALGIGVTLITLSELLGFAPYLQSNGVHDRSLLMFCVIFGFSGAIISLLFSKTLVKRSLRIEVLDPSRDAGELRWLLQTVQLLADKSGLPRVPEVGVYSSPELNAFATGPSRSDSLIAISTGLLSAMNRDEIEGVLGHEVAHIANGDMIRMTLLQGVINTLVLFLVRGLAFALAATFDSNKRYATRMIVVLLLEALFGFLGMLVVNGYSRLREFRADSGGASLAGRDKMIGALEALRDRASVPDNREPQLAVFKIFGNTGGWAGLLLTHPPLEARLRALRGGH